MSEALKKLEQVVSDAPPLQQSVPDDRWRKQIAALGFDNEKLDLIRMKCIPYGTPDSEVYRFLRKASEKRLDPLDNEVWLQKQYVADGPGRTKPIYIIGIGIGGYRKIADRTGRYRPGRESHYEFKPDGTIDSVTVYIQVYDERTKEWSEVSGNARFDEYAVWKFNTKTQEKELARHWAKMPVNQTEKCAEVKAIRRGFPNETEGMYIQEELEQMGSVTEQAVQAADIGSRLTASVERRIQEEGR